MHLEGPRSLSAEGLLTQATEESATPGRALRKPYCLQNLQTRTKGKQSWLLQGFKCIAGLSSNSTQDRLPQHRHWRSAWRLTLWLEVCARVPISPCFCEGRVCHRGSAGAGGLPLGLQLQRLALAHGWPGERGNSNGHTLHPPAPPPQGLPQTAGGAPDHTAQDLSLWQHCPPNTLAHRVPDPMCSAFP